MTNQRLTDEQVHLYHQQGYLVVKNFCSKAEIDKLYQTALEDSAIKNETVAMVYPGK
jgi:ectoine hydroxylase-related dioxygenase (phytanoyl-CoA dioxygenase family)